MKNSRDLALLLLCRSVCSFGYNVRNNDITEWYNARYILLIMSNYWSSALLKSVTKNAINCLCSSAPATRRESPLLVGEQGEIAEIINCLFRHMHTVCWVGIECDTFLQDTEITWRKLRRPDETHIRPIKPRCKRKLFRLKEIFYLY